MTTVWFDVVNYTLSCITYTATHSYMNILSYCSCSLTQHCMHVTQYTHTLHYTRGINAQVQEVYDIYFKYVNKQLHHYSGTQQYYMATLQHHSISLAHCVTLFSLLGCCNLVCVVWCLFFASCIVLFVQNNVLPQT
jgi:hypothetical protein